MLKFERARFAKVYVEVNLQKPLKGTVMINGEKMEMEKIRLLILLGPGPKWSRQINPCEALFLAQLREKWIRV